MEKWMTLNEKPQTAEQINLPQTGKVEIYGAEFDPSSLIVLVLVFCVVSFAFGQMFSKKS